MPSPSLGPMGLSALPSPPTTSQNNQSPAPNPGAGPVTAAELRLLLLLHPAFSEGLLKILAAVAGQRPDPAEEIGGFVAPKDRDEEME
ncbi:hypothetical protein PENDEC_c040G04379 [Penicillium decumbens]|uniref:Uncharacterized protein n=1 Tax=Penicillium decumbens TaxID=69771 RepID=A0A1V6NRF8_PENDC|nr:hypothetical protein PENDEC_c040G04379 [Penicillium decumbens]